MAFTIHQYRMEPRREDTTNLKIYIGNFYQVWGLWNVRGYQIKNMVAKRLLPWTSLKTINFQQVIMGSQGKTKNSGSSVLTVEQLGHISKSCSKPKLECKKCGRIGHTETGCTWSSKVPQPGTSRNVMPLNTKDEQHFKKCYFVLCKVNNFLCEGMVDTGCAVVTLRQRDAKRFGLKWYNCNIQINGYAGGKAKAIGKTVISMEVDLVKANVEALIVPDELQDVSVIIGQPFINQANVALVIKDDQIRIFNSDILQLPEIDKLPPSKIKMIVSHDVTIPPNHIGHIQFTTDQEFNGDLFVDFQVRCAPAHEYILPRCVTSSSSGLLPVLNASNSMLKFKSQETIARGTPCQPEDDLARKSVHEDVEPGSSGRL
ncbi:unnamed protein product [Callosobruchus maculatus]|uniref:CCHC-type domain-containing protein n=1 Tax=Callosobruchus maculatus TaxID=64391 RepID=A0A653D095_CALMS|nr:unnamed protein product [Callosobruchus maculatus]